jgi:hypothetical protein
MPTTEGIHVTIHFTFYLSAQAGIVRLANVGRRPGAVIRWIAAARTQPLAALDRIKKN